MSSQASSSPMGRLPMSPMNSRATGRLNGAKPSMAPLSASATRSASGGSAPSAPMTAMPTVTGTTSATIIQSMPSMKLTRLMNHSAPTNSRPRSSQKGMKGSARMPSGRAPSIKAIAAACTRQLRQGTELEMIIGGAEQHHEKSGEQGHENAVARRLVPQPGKKHRSGAHAKGRSTDGESAPLRRRRPVRGAVRRDGDGKVAEYGRQGEDQQPAEHERIEPGHGRETSNDGPGGRGVRHRNRSSGGPSLRSRTRERWLGRQDSNLGMTESKSVALPLGDAPSPPR